MSKIVYRIQMAVEVELDAKKPDAIAKVGQWMQGLAESKFLTPPEGLPLTVEVTKGPDIVTRRE